jgi:hypothetical protein
MGTIETTNRKSIMRKITERICNAFLDGKRLKIGNTLTEDATIWLHGNKIAFWLTDEVLQISLAGYNTVTTRERLNGLLTTLGSNWRIVQRDYRPYAINHEMSSHINLIEVDWYGLTNMASGNHRWYSRGNTVARRPGVWPPINIKNIEDY